MSEDLNEKQRRFVDAYIADPNATRAALTAGYSPASAATQGNALLQNPKVARALEAARRDRRQRARLTADDIVRALEDIVLFDPRRLFAEGKPKDMHELDEADARMVVERWADANGQRVKWGDRLKALDMLAKHHGLLEHRVTMRVDQGVDLGRLSTEQLAQLEEILDDATPDEA